MRHMKRMKPLAWLPLGLALALGQPAQAAPAEPAQPWIAPALTLGAPAVIAAGAPLGVYPYHWGMAPVVLAGLSAGHVYAGDPWRGVLVALGAPVVGFGTQWGVTGLAYQLNPFPTYERGSTALGIGLIATAVVATTYLTWAAVDAYQTAERVNRERAEAAK